MGTKKITREQWIEEMKSEGFELYKTEDLKPKIDAFNEIKDIIEGND